MEVDHNWHHLRVELDEEEEEEQEEQEEQEEEEEHNWRYLSVELEVPAMVCSSCSLSAGNMETVRRENRGLAVILNCT